MTKTIAWTGHRPKDLPQGYNYRTFATVVDELLPESDWTNTEFVVGGALGIDTFAANYALIREIPFHIILPFAPETMNARWGTTDAQALYMHMKFAKSVRIIHTGPYDVRMYQLRNEAMVDMADEVWTFWSGKLWGGTANCIRYALRRKRTVLNIRNRHYVLDI